MTTQTITVTLPESVYKRLTETAQAFSMTQEEVLRESIALLMPALESDLSLEEHQNLSELALLSDLDLWKVARSMMSEERQQSLEALASFQKQRSLTGQEQTQLATLMTIAEQIMLRKAEAYRLLAMRGHTVFPAV